ncbi:adenosylcobinamide-phosphate synthase CbiB [bacterium]|nr:adenosylcobinamide-phosphate synthase CbiB [bacterium]
MKECLIILLLAFVLDLYLGDPVYPLHPVRLMGHLIKKIEDFLEKRALLTVLGGVLLLTGTQVIVIGVYLGLLFLLSGYAVLLHIFIVYSSISIKDLIKHGKAVLARLEAEDLSGARNAVQMLIGRDAQYLDEYGVARAAVESLAENFVDGFLAPLLWFALGAILADKIGLSCSLGGGVFILFYKVTNTLDSMVGYKNERYLDFGKTGARLDDVLNFVPARLGIPVVVIAARICRLDWKKAWKIGWRDRLKHTSPNAGHTEACVAGALNIRLNGPGIYPHGRVEKPWVGDGTEQVTSQHLKQAFYLILSSAFLATALCAGLIIVF